MVTAGSRDHAGLWNIGTEDDVKGAARLERSRMLEAFELEKNPGIKPERVLF
jgi:hypothetical protein